MQLAACQEIVIPAQAEATQDARAPKDARQPEYLEGARQVWGEVADHGERQARAL
ncbi:MAG TPA: hypothetical protein VLV88_04395 [Terriglobales bacterium]|nr:hypothetical protein [Terriglobales bacterium]